MKVDDVLMTLVFVVGVATLIVLERARRKAKRRRS